MERVIRELGSAGQSHVSLPGSGTPETPESGATEAERMRALMQAPTGVVESSQARGWVGYSDGMYCLCIGLVLLRCSCRWH